MTGTREWRRPETNPDQEPPSCPYCGQASTFHASSAIVYSGRDYGAIWACLDCKAWVGCHKGTNVPLGRLADAQLRTAKQTANAVFDPMWKAKMERDGVAKHEARSAGYRWLAGQLGIDVEQCHIGMFDLETCQRATQICRLAGQVGKIRRDAAAPPPKGLRYVRR